MAPSASAVAGQAARVEELRGECAKAFVHYKKGNLTQATNLVKNLLARHPANPLPHNVYVRLSHLLALEQKKQPAVDVTQFERATEAMKACPDSLLPSLLFAQLTYDFPPPENMSGTDGVLAGLRRWVADAAAMPLNNAAADIEYAKAIATFDESALLFFPDVRECADSAAYRSAALANLAKAPAMITDLHREAERLAKNNPGQSVRAHFIDLRDAEHAAETARAAPARAGARGDAPGDGGRGRGARPSGGGGGLARVRRPRRRQCAAFDRRAAGAWGRRREEDPSPGKELPGAQRRCGQRGRRHAPEGAPQVRGLRRARRAPHDLPAVPRRSVL